MNKEPTTLQADGFRYSAEPSEIVHKLLDATSPQTAIDIGAGAGRNVRLLLDRGCTVTAAEVGPESLTALRKIATEKPQLKVVESRLQDITPTERFDAVLCNMTLHFLQPGEIPAAISTLRQLTAPNGVVCISSYLQCPENESLPAHYTFKLQPGELQSHFGDWNILFYNEDFPSRKNRGAINKHVNDGKGYKNARIIARNV